MTSHLGPCKTHRVVLQPATDHGAKGRSGLAHGVPNAGALGRIQRPRTRARCGRRAVAGRTCLATPDRRAAQPRRSDALPSAVADPVPGVGRTRRRRLVVIGLRPGRGIPHARRAHLPRGRARERDDRHRDHHLDGVQPHHRAVPARRWQLPGGDQAVRRSRRRGVGLCAAGRLRPHHHGVDRSGGRCPLQPAADRLAAREARGRGDPDPGPQHAQPARRARVGDDPCADLPGLPRDPRPGDRRWDPGPRRRVARDCEGGVRRLRRGRHHSGDRRAAAALRARLLARRRHLHRDRGRLQRAPDHARAARPDGQADHALHGVVAGLHRDRSPALLSAVGRRSRGRQDLERGAGRAARRRRAARRGVRRALPRLRGRAPRRRGAGRLPRRPARARQHGGGLVGAPPLRGALGPASRHTTGSCS